jgi:hypothetical protein
VQTVAIENAELSPNRGAQVLIDGVNGRFLGAHDDVGVDAQRGRCSGALPKIYHLTTTNGADISEYRRTLTDGRVA